jgi:transaldolase
MSIKQLTSTGTKVWSDSVEPGIIAGAGARGITGATSNPIIIADIIKAGGLDERITQLIEQGLDDSAIAWKLNDELVADAQKTFLPVWERTKGNDGYVSFELDPLIEDPERNMPQAERVKRYVELAAKYAKGHKNRMIKVPATEAGIACLEELAANGVTINVTLCFTERQYKLSRDAIWRGVQRRKSGLDGFQIGLQHLRLARRRVHREEGPLARQARSRARRHRQRQADVGDEPGFLARQGAQAPAGDHLRQHRQEAPVAVR